MLGPELGVRYEEITAILLKCWIVESQACTHLKKRMHAFVKSKSLLCIFLKNRAHGVKSKTWRPRNNVGSGHFGPNLKPVVALSIMHE